MWPAFPMATSRICEQMLAATKSQVDPSEAELIQRVLSGQDEAFRELVRPYEHALFVTSQAILKNEGDPEDAAQEAILKDLRIFPSSAVNLNSAPGWSASPQTKLS
jgi:hypothetical protein